MGFIGKLLSRHAIAQWQDEVTFSAVASMNQAATDLIAEYELMVRKADWKDGLLRRSSYIQREVAPLVDEASARISAVLLADASAHLRRVVDLDVGPLGRADKPKIDDPLAADWADLLKATVPLGGAFVAGLALPGAAITTTTAWFGLATITVVSWPIMVGGGAAIGTALAIGAHNTTQVRGRFEARLHDKIKTYIIQALLHGKDDNPAVLERLQHLYARTADRAREHCR